MSLKLQQKLSFQMIQSLKLLQLNTLQLEQMIRNELQLNPVLETSEETEEELDQEQSEAKEEVAETTGEEEIEIKEDEINWEEYVEASADDETRTSDESEQTEQRFERTPVYHQTLEEHLLNQLSEKKLPEHQNLLVQFVIGCISSDGYLRMSVDDLADAVKATPQEMEEALNVVERMDPPGVGARNLQECLVLQLRAKSQHDTLAMRILVETWDLFEKMKIPEIGRQLGVTSHEVQDAVEVLKTLSPKPGYLVNPERPATIIPDLIVEKINGEFVVMLNDRSVPSLRISKAYAEMIKRGSQARKEVKEWVRGKLNGATWLIRSIEQRQNTMLRVMYAIIQRQKDFFEKGPPNLSPLKLQDIADMVEMHISTVSRVTNDKYVQTPHGVYELKYFFTEGISRESDGTDISSERIKSRIRELVEGENTQRPLSDQKLAEILSKEDLGVARRTVAKYREQLKILPARLRQKYD